jgi:nitroimidazol reductase NimA-like FMN-containing flavoprotein (pyridoxamine 5'-phosphate oxidase superfamily)
MNQSEIDDVLTRPLSQELLKRGMVRLAYTAKDGTPRVIPTGFTWNGSTVVSCTPGNAPKIASLRNNPAVALTIDTDDHPPKILLIRGTAELDFVNGIPDEFVSMNMPTQMTPEQRESWETEIRSLYADGMYRIVITPTWAKLIDFENTLPQAVAELVQRRASRT